MAGILTGLEIEKEYLAGNIIIHPKNRQAGPNSYDVSLGRYIWRQSAGPFDRPAGKTLYLINDAASIESHWQADQAVTWESALAALLAAGQLTESEVNSYAGKMDLNELVIILYPGELILGHTEEFIGSVGTAPITTEMKARSSAGRSGISVCKCAGMGDPGYCTRWTMEIKNEGNKIVPLRVGANLAQIVFITLAGEVVSYTKDGHYFNLSAADNQTDDNEGLIKNMVDTWFPEMMLPSHRAL